MNNDYSHRVRQWAASFFTPQQSDSSPSQLIKNVMAAQVY